MCKAHANADCKSCCELPRAPGLCQADTPLVGWKKQITKLHKEGKKAGMKKNDNGWD